MDEIMQIDYNLAADFLDSFSCNSQNQGYYDFVELVWRIRTKWREKGGESPVLNVIVKEMCKERKLPMQLFYSRMKRVVKPILSAEPQALQACGIKLEKPTSSALAYALARFLEYGS